jgi:hypothetical protein
VAVAHVVVPGKAVQLGHSTSRLSAGGACLYY